MNFENEKYEYLLHTWGGFYNKEHKDVHAHRPGYYFFDTKEELNTYLDELLKSQKELDASTLAFEINEGKHVRYKTIASMVFVYDGKKYPFEYDFGYAYPVKSAEYMFNDGNYACDCNRSLFLMRKYGIPAEELACGYTIDMQDFKVRQVRKPEKQVV